MGGGLALTRRTGGGGGFGANEAHGGGGSLALTRRAPSPICASYNEVRSFSQTLGEVAYAQNIPVRGLLKTRCTIPWPCDKRLFSWPHGTVSADIKMMFFNTTRCLYHLV